MLFLYFVCKLHKALLKKELQLEGIFLHSSYGLDQHCKVLNEPQHVISNNVVCATSKGSDQPAHTHSLIRAFASCLNIL